MAEGTTNAGADLARSQVAEPPALPIAGPQAASPEAGSPGTQTVVATRVAVPAAEIPAPSLGALGIPPLQELGLWRIAGAFALSAISDVVSAATELVPPLQIVVDLITAGLLWMLLGWRWVMLPAFVAEAIPGLALFPTWLLVTTACVVSPKVKN